MVIVCFQHSLSEVSAFFQVPHGSVDLRSTAVSTFQEVAKYSRAGLQYAIAQHTVSYIFCFFVFVVVPTRIFPIWNPSRLPRGKPAATELRYPTLISYYFPHVKSGSLSLRKASCDRVALPNLNQLLASIVVYAVFFMLPYHQLLLFYDRWIWDL